jgi:hypothetical protein
MNLLNTLLSFFCSSPKDPIKPIEVKEVTLINPAPPEAAKVDVNNLDFRECLTSWTYIKDKYPFQDEDISHKFDLKLAEDWREALADNKSVICHVSIWPTKGATYFFDYLDLALFNNDLDSYFKNYIGDRDVAAYSHKHVIHWLNEPHQLSTASAPFDILSREDFISQKFKQKLDIVDSKPAGSATHGKEGPSLS